MSRLRFSIHEVINRVWICGKRFDMKRKRGMVIISVSSSFGDIFLVG